MLAVTIDERRAGTRFWDVDVFFFVMRFLSPDMAPVGRQGF
jgi:hypothetical protein